MGTYRLIGMNSDVCAFDLLRLLFPNGMCAWIAMAAIGPPTIRIPVHDAKRRYEFLQL
jgi:hypothetical protein